MNDGARIVQEARASRPIWKSLGELLFPWTLLLYVHWLGMHWTIIGLAALYVLSLAFALGGMFGSDRG